MKNIFHNPVYIFPFFLTLAVTSLPTQTQAQTLAQTQTDITSQKKADNIAQNNIAQKIIVKNGVLVPFEQNHDFAKGYFVIENKSSHDLLLQDITSPLCDHISANHSDDVQLSYQTGGDNIFKHLAIPRNSVMVFPKEGYHLICYGLKPLKSGKTSSPFTFYFRENIKVTTDFSFSKTGDNTL